ncbi:MAG TPA: PAS domain-containing protein, partial [Acidobacteriaceae bacterium]|nr:PAS domain-containing protein [Acidobacteriaceae bacterium]
MSAKTRQTGLSAPPEKRPEDDAREFFRDIVNTVREPMLVLDADLRVVMASQSFLDVFNLSSGDPTNSLLYDLGSGQWNIPQLRELLEEVLPERKVVRDFRMDADFARMGRKSLLLNA